MFWKKPLVILGFILVFAFAVRVIGIGYGLPLWLFDDEPSFVTSALKMLEVKTLVPRFHPVEFSTLLYYPPYLSYLYLLPFSLVIGIQYLFFYGDKTQFVNYLLTDASQFFIIARTITIIMGVLTVWLLYKTAKQIFKNEKIALLSAFFLASSVTHANLSAFAIHWIPATFFIMLGLFFVTNPRFSQKKKHTLCAITAGIGFGFSVMSIFTMLFVLITYIFIEKKTIINALREKTLYLSFIIFLALTVIPLILNPKSFGFASDTTLAGNTKSLLGLLTSPVWFFKSIMFIEPILVIFAFMGLCALFVNKKHRPYIFIIISFIICYAVIFYLGFRFEERFALPLIPILALTAGYGSFFLLDYTAKNRLAFWVILLILLVPVGAEVKLDWLKYNNDNRMKARHWVEKNLAPNTKIAVYASLTRVASTPLAISQQENIDNASLRRVDRAERSFDKNFSGTPRFHALNLYSVSNRDFFNSLDVYLRENNYQYILVSTKPNNNLPYYETFSLLTERAKRITIFGEDKNIEKFTSGSLGNIIQLFTAKSVGLPVAIYKLQ